MKDIRRIQFIHQHTMISKYIRPNPDQFNYYPTIPHHGLILLDCKVRSPYTYMQSDLALYSLLLYHSFLSIKLYSKSFNSLQHNPDLPQNHDYRHLWKRKLLKTLCKKEKMLVTFSPFSTMFSSLSNIHFNF